MKEILLAPFKTIYNLDIYIKAMKQNVWRTLLFLVYLFVLSSVLFFAGIALKTPSLTPFLQDLTEQIAQMTPDIEVKNGIINAIDTYSASGLTLMLNLSIILMNADRLDQICENAKHQQDAGVSDCAMLMM